MSKKKEQTNTKIKCDVSTCVHNDCNVNCCKLEEIKVSCNCCGDEVSNKDETICNSYRNIEN